MFAWPAISAFLKSPLFKYIIAFVVVASILYGAFWLGGDRVQTKWDLEKVKVQAVIDQLTANQGKVTEKIVTVYVDKIKTVKVKGDTITEYVDRYITVESDKQCIIPQNFIMLLDSAALNIVPPAPVEEKIK